MEERNYKVYVHISPSSKRYIGITKQEPEKRWANGRGYKDNKHFWNSIQKYGWDNFKHFIIDNLTKEEACDLEIHLIALYDTTNRDKGYNITLGGEGANGIVRTEEWKQQHSERMSGENNPMYGKQHTEETRKKISEAHSGKTHSEETRKKISEAHSGENHPMYGKHLAEETRKKISEAKSGKTLSEEHKNKISEARDTPVICITTKRIFFSQKEGAECYGIKSSGSISACCKGKRKSAGKYNGKKLVWRYITWQHNKTYRIVRNNKEVA